MQMHLDAIDLFQKSIEINPQYERAYANKGFAYIRVDKYEKAIITLSEAIAIDDNFFAPYLSRYVAYGYMNNVDCAKRDLKKAFELNKKMLKKDIEADSFADFSELRKRNFDVTKHLEEIERGIEGYPLTDPIPTTTQKNPLTKNTKNKKSSSGTPQDTETKKRIPQNKRRK